MPLWSPRDNLAMQSAEAAHIDVGKAQVVDRVPKVIKEIKFGVMYGESHMAHW